jgi:hypothetical protein
MKALAREGITYQHCVDSTNLATGVRGALKLLHNLASHREAHQGTARPIPQSQGGGVMARQKKTFPEVWAMVQEIHAARETQPDLWRRIAALVRLEASFIETVARRRRLSRQCGVTRLADWRARS